MESDYVRLYFCEKGQIQEENSPFWGIWDEFPTIYCVKMLINY